MDKSEIALIRKSWRLASADADAAAALFYNTLFKLDPELRRLFKGDMAKQGQQLMKMIGVAVGRLESARELVPVLRDLADRHIGYGVQEAHYATVGSALLGTLEQALGAEFTPPTRNAWRKVYTFIADTMIARTRELAARGAPAA